jgi:hypothetical protein
MEGVFIVKIAAAIGASMLGLVLGTTTIARAQHGHGDEQDTGSHKEHGNGHQKEHGRSSEQHLDKHHANAPEQRHEQHSHDRRDETQDRSDRQQTHHQQASSPEHMREADRRDHEQYSRPRDVWQGHRAEHWEHEHHTWHERGGYRGYRIPEDRFRAHFGRGHWFRVHRTPIIVVNGYPRFQYEGFWFTLVDPWPEYWSRTWYETDDVYVDYVNDGYYMVNRRYPRVAIAVDVSF